MTPPAALDAPYELPGAREVVGRGFELMLAATGQLRRVSLYFGGLFLAFLGPLLVLGVVVVLTAPPELKDLADIIQSGGRPGAIAPIRDAGWSTAFLLLMFGAYAAAIGVALVAIEGGIVGIALLTGHRLKRPVTLRHALVRSRQVFWRVVRASFLLGMLSTIVQGIAGAVLGAADLPSDASTVVTVVISTLVATPFCYSQAGIVLGDVGARESLRRSVQLFRARPLTALVIALFPAVFGGVIELWALSAGGEILLLLGQVTNLGFGTDVIHSTITVVVLLAAIMATGSLFFTLGALFAAPQVVAFLGLTHYAGGLDRAVADRAVADRAVADRAVADRAAPPALLAAAAPPAPAPRGFAPLPALRLLPSPPALPVRAAQPPVSVSAWAAVRDPGSAFHWVTRPMLGTIILGLAMTILGVAVDLGGG